ncbi:MAG: ATP-dependent helicase HrpB [Planctomycetota bacterium]
MQPLPIDDQLHSIVQAVSSGMDVVLQAPPGSGKTTRVPAALVDARLKGGGKVLVLEPRRMAARLAARRVAQERGGAVGEEVGYRVRFEGKEGRDTRLLFLTEGVLVRKLLADAELPGVSAVVFDEFHERSLQADLALLLVREVQSTLRPELRIVILSATIEAEPLAEELGARVIRSEGRQYPVEIEHVERREEGPIPAVACRAVLRQLDREGGRLEGDVLVFLPGVGEIQRTLAELRPVADARGFDLLPLHGELDAEQQDRAILAGPRPRVVLSTNVAETSVTLEGIRTVIDTGWARVMRHDPASGVDRLSLERITRSSADQRAGRAGRLGPGRCLRLFTAGEMREMRPSLEPEVLRVDLCESLLLLKAWGTADPRQLPWITPPAEAGMAAALDLLALLGAIESPAGPVTDLGRRLARLPVHPRLGRMLLEAGRRRCGSDGALLAALCQIRPRLSSRGGPSGRSDLLQLRDLFLEARDARFDRSVCERLGVKVRELRAVDREARALDRHLERRGDSRENEDDLLKCVLAGHPDRVARRRGKGSEEALMTGGFALRLDQATVVRDDEFFVALDVTRLGSGQQAKVRLASAVDLDWIAELHPGLSRQVDETIWSEERQRAEGRRCWFHLDLLLKEHALPSPDPAQAEELLARAACHSRFLESLLKDRRLEQTLLRVECLRASRPDLGLEPVGEEALAKAVREACHGRTSLAELRASSLREMLVAGLGRDAAFLLERLCPARIRLPSGRQAEITYRLDGPPLVSGRLQEFFGGGVPPSIMEGRVLLAVDLLAPNGRSVQITADLQSFWSTVYPRERKELARRYPRHPWPEIPAAATPTARPLPRRRG